MTSLRFPSCLLLAAAMVASGASSAQEVPGSEEQTSFTDRTTDAQLRILQSSRSFRDAVRIEAPKVSARTLGSASDFIVFNGISTLVPKTAILHVPPGQEGSVRSAPEGRLITFHEFLAINRARIELFEVSRDEAIGKTPIDPERLGIVKRSKRFVVAVLGGNPVSVSTRSAARASSAGASSNLHRP